jgi:hypothetical protein
MTYIGSRESENSPNLSRLLAEQWQYPPQPSQRISLSVRVFEDAELSTRTTLEGVVGNLVQVPPVEIQIVQR